MDFSMKMVRDIPSLISYHYKEGNINWPMGIYISLVHVVATVGLFTISKCSNETLIWAFLLWPISGFGITVGVHRLWSHRSYEASFPVRLFLMLCNSIANQGSIFHWARDHRVHHKYSETDADPHNATRGFFFAHMGWLFVKKHPDVVKAGRELDFSDLKEDSTVMFQKKLDPWFALYMCYVMPAQVASYFWGEDFWNAFFVAGGLRYCVVLHFTWLVNSAAHLYGDHPYDVLSYPSENPIVSWCSVGEGWHNWHHKYPFDYAASEFGVSSQFNPSKLFIDILAALGLVWGRKRATAAWQMGRVRRDRDAAAGIPLPKAPPRPWEVDAKKAS
jgi:stearoyl-CoA desaturase (delta-9 desaturase)